MKDSSKVIMGATLVMVVSLAIVLGLVLVLLVELYCSILLRRRRLRNTTNTTNTSASPSQSLQAQDRSPSPLSSFYAQGVLDAPRSFLFPAVSSKENNVEIKNQSLKLQSVLEIQTQKSNTNHHHMGIISPPSQSTPLITSPHPIQEIPIQVATNSTSGCSGGGGCREHFVYISNPIYDNNDASRLVSRADTPFETPYTSPSRLETDGSSGEDESLVVTTPPLTPMKKLPVEACSVALRDVGTSGSDSVSNNGLSSSSSGSPRTSPSW
ncbi:hypothetical protein Ddye_020904 [Dipteronia dyeriana]|uniref:Uncharacterized protein n=1 Tax=Dipteronia dyeriana TaxID=168575 RepID=A0AAD9U1P0_9ROSI|nr:hypothetical protein Ddye_020895 [Dipteronia dyeriana]KAK2645709.1 hypothetical protein Ddye_020904 [Dipteronia dyeriana]